MTCVPSVWRRRATSKPRAPSNAYDANADESRYLLGRDHRATHEAAFLAKSESLYGMKGVDLPSYEPRLADTWKAYRADHEDKRFTGELRRELDNITFPGSGPPPAGIRSAGACPGPSPACSPPPSWPPWVCARALPSSADRAAPLEDRQDAFSMRRRPARDPSKSSYARRAPGFLATGRP